MVCHIVSAAAASIVHRCYSVTRHERIDIPCHIICIHPQPTASAQQEKEKEEEKEGIRIHYTRRCARRGCWRSWRRRMS